MVSERERKRKRCGEWPHLSGLEFMGVFLTQSSCSLSYALPLSLSLSLYVSLTHSHDFLSLSLVRFICANIYAELSCQLMSHSCPASALVPCVCACDGVWNCKEKCRICVPTDPTLNQLIIPCLCGNIVIRGSLVTKLIIAIIIITIFIVIGASFDSLCGRRRFVLNAKWGIPPRMQGQCVCVGVLFELGIKLAKTYCGFIFSQWHYQDCPTKCAIWCKELSYKHTHIPTVLTYIPYLRTKSLHLFILCLILCVAINLKIQLLSRQGCFNRLE